MRQLLPNWYYGFLPPDWWPDRPREAYFPTLNVIPKVASTTETVEMIFNKRRDCIAFGGCFLVTDPTGATINAPLSGIWSRKLIRLRTPGGIVYTQQFTNAGVTTVPDLGFVPVESVFAAWQHAADRAAVWPVPILIPRGGSLLLDIQDLGGTTTHLRITFWAGILYEAKDVRDRNKENAA